MGNINRHFILSGVVVFKRKMVLDKFTMIHDFKINIYFV